MFKPLVTEKLTHITDKYNKYGFVFSCKESKLDIKRTIEKIYEVKVRKVYTMNYDGKIKSRNVKKRNILGKTNSFKKAIVSLEKGYTIDFYKNVI